MYVWEAYSILPCKTAQNLDDECQNESSNGIRVWNCSYVKGFQPLRTLSKERTAYSGIPRSIGKDLLPAIASATNPIKIDANWTKFPRLCLDKWLGCCNVRENCVDLTSLQQSWDGTGGDSVGIYDEKWCRDHALTLTWPALSEVHRPQRIYTRLCKVSFYMLC